MQADFFPLAVLLDRLRLDGVGDIVLGIVAVILLVAWLIIPLLTLAAVRSLRRRAEAQLIGFEKFAEVHTNLLSQIAKETEALARCSTDLLDAIETTHELDAEAQEIEAKAYQRLKNLEELTAHTHRLLEWLGKQTQLSNQTASEGATETEQ